MTAKLCLTMIVKNEAAVIERCLRAALPHIACYCICDTGSTDGTPGVVTRFFEEHGIPGGMPAIDFKNFGQARTEMLELARSELPADLFNVHLFCDADMEVASAPETPFRYRLDLEHRPAPAFRIAVRDKGLEYWNTFLLRRDVPARYVGYTHEYLEFGGGLVAEDIHNLWLIDHLDGSNRAEKFERDLRLLNEERAASPTPNSRTLFYLGQTCFDMGKYADAVVHYSSRINLGGWPEETFYARYRQGQALMRLGRTGDGIEALLDAFERMPSRAEPLHVISQHYLRASQHELAYLFAHRACHVAKPDAGLFVEPDVYLWRVLDIQAVALFYLGNKAAAETMFKALLSLVPIDQLERTKANLAFCRK